MRQNTSSRLIGRGSCTQHRSSRARSPVTSLRGYFARSLLYRGDCRQRGTTTTALPDKRAPERKPADDAIETLVDVTDAMPVKSHPILDPAYARTSKTRLRQKLGPGMERRNLEQVVHARQRLSANQCRKRTVNQYARNSLWQMAGALFENESFPHVSPPEPANIPKIVLRTPLAEPLHVVPGMHASVDFN